MKSALSSFSPQLPRAGTNTVITNTLRALPYPMLRYTCISCRSTWHYLQQ